MDLRGHTIIYGSLTAATAGSFGGAVYFQNYHRGNQSPVRTVSNGREALDGYVEWGLLDSDRPSIARDCWRLGNGEECRAIMEWAYGNGQCNVYYLDESDNLYHHWYLGKIPEGLLGELEKNQVKYRGLCGDKKSINFHYDKGEGRWKYDGYDRHSWDFEGGK